VEAAGVEPAISVENNQLTDSENARNAENATISKSAVQSLYKHCLKFPELQPSDFSRSAQEHSEALLQYFRRRPVQATGKWRCCEPAHPRFAVRVLRIRQGRQVDVSFRRVIQRSSTPNLKAQPESRCSSGLTASGKSVVDRTVVRINSRVSDTWR
jgi:hypothetical protein